MGCAQLLFGGVRPSVRQPSSRDGSKLPPTTDSLYFATVAATASRSRPSSAATPATLSAFAGPYIGGRNRRLTFASQIE